MSTMGSKAWKLSASVIVALRSPSVRVGTSKLTDTLSKTARDDQCSVERNNLQILSLRRGESDKYLPGYHVFPGGNLDTSDSISDWLELYKSFGYDENSFLSLSVGFPEYSVDSDLPNWLSLRLCAIRETFEESGVLLGRIPSGADRGSTWASFVTVRELELWQRRVKADPRQMMALCQAEGCVPDVWGLHLWSNWLTPTQVSFRHNTIFFIAVLHSQPQHSLDTSEMDELKWCSPCELISGSYAGTHRLLNPQFYEASRLAVFADAESLASFAESRAQRGCARYMPVLERTENGILFILPGDTAYPKNIDFEKPQDLVTRSKSFDELSDSIRLAGGTLHRIQLPNGSLHQNIVIHNFVPPYKHVIPITSSNVPQKLVNKL